MEWERRSELSGEGGGLAREDRVDATANAVLLVDSVGELGAWWGTASIGFVGGSFGSREGQNMLEPAAYGVATCFGPRTRNFRDIVSQLLASEGAEVVRDRDEIEQFVRRAIDNPASARQLGERGQALVLAQQGATERTVQLLMQLVGRTTLVKQEERPAA